MAGRDGRGSRRPTQDPGTHNTTPDPRTVFAEWLGASPYDTVDGLLGSKEFRDAVDEHGSSGEYIISDVRGVEWSPYQGAGGDQERLHDLGFETMPVKSGEVRIPPAGQVAVVVPEDPARPVLVAWRGGDKPGERPNGGQDENQTQ